MVKMKNHKFAYCFKCKRETPLVINKVRKQGKEVLQIGKCLVCSNKITLVENANIIKS